MVTSDCKTILVVEDDHEIRVALQELLELDGYKTFGAANGRAGLDLLPRINRPCLILLDLMMPVMDGWEFLNVKKKDESLKPIPVVVVSAADRVAKSNCVVRYLKKPINFDVLIDVVREHCSEAH